MKKVAKKRKIDTTVPFEDDDDDDDDLQIIIPKSLLSNPSTSDSVPAVPAPLVKTASIPPPEKIPTEKIREVSLFESQLTYKCQWCSKRTNDLDKMETHLKIDHPNRTIADDNAGYKTMTRDQVIDMITLNLTSTIEGGFICYFCEDVVGTIADIKNHFAVEHVTEINIKVKRVQDGKKPAVSGYLECQLCGYLSPGLDRSKQRVHFHDEHPLEQSVNCSKYVSKVTKNQPNQAKLENADPLKYIGMVMKCPKGPDCTFETDSMPAMNAHFRKHTQTFKCGHCGKTHPNSSEFHRHSAMLHGDK